MGKRANGEGTIWKRADGKFEGKLPPDPLTGKRKKVVASTRREAAERLNELKRKQQQGVNVHLRQQTLAGFLEQWLEETIKPPHRRARTYISYGDTIRLYITPQIGHIALDKLTPAHIQAMINALAKDEGHTRKVQYAHSVLSRALNRAVKWGLILRNPAKAVDAPRVTTRAIAPLSEDSARALLAAISGHRLEALYRLMLGLGLRRGEVLALRWADVDLDTATLKISGTLQRVAGKLTRTVPKTKASARTLTIPAVLVEALRLHWRRLQDERRSPEWREHGYVFPSEIGTPLEPRNLNRHFTALLKRANLPPIRLHDLRHSCATFLIAQGVHPRVVMEILGHSQISVTMNLYGHVADQTQREAVEKLSRIVG